MAGLVEKFYSRLWTLRFLKRSGLPKGKLIEVYCTIIRPAIEYSSVVYHTLISNELAEKLEAMQRHAVRIICGFDGDVRNKMEDIGMSTLRERREEAVLKFAIKNERNPRYGGRWFQETQQRERSVRASTWSKYVEQRCRTGRMQNNPINYMTKMLNEHYRL